MYIYFCSDYPAVVKLDGKVYKKLSTIPAKIPLSASTFVEICPLIEGIKPTNFYLDQDFLQSQNQSLAITDLEGGYLIHFNKVINEQQSGVVFQHKTDKYALSIFNEHGKKLSLETPSDFLIDNLEWDVDSAKIAFYDKDCVGICLDGRQTVILVYYLCDKITKILERVVDDWSYNSRLTTTNKFKDIAKHSLTCDWEFTKGKTVKSNAILTHSPNFHPTLLSHEVLPYAFLEEVMLDGQIDFYLCENVLASKDKLKGYLGNFIGVCPPPNFHNQDKVGVLYRTGLNRYQVKYLQFELKDGKIFNLKFV